MKMTLTKNRLVKLFLMLVPVIMLVLPCSTAIAGVKDWWYDISDIIKGMRNELSITGDEATDDDLKLLLRYNDYTTYRLSVKAYLDMIEYGHQLDRFLHGAQQVCSAPSGEKDFFEFMDKPATQGALTALQNALSVWSHLPGIGPLLQLTSTTLTLYSGSSMYKRVADAFLCFDKKQLMYEYFDLRPSLSL